MKKLQPPMLDCRTVYDACIENVANAERKANYQAAADQFVARAADYLDHANSHGLHEISPCAVGNDEQVILGGLNKGDLRRVYESGMLKGQRGRAFYDMLLNSTPLGKCPYCGFGHAETLDHFLSKAHYPQFSVLPINLVPACMRCNKGKGSGIASQDLLISHPYFEDARIERDIWLTAAILEGFPATVRYIFSPPEDWSDGISRRVNNYFREFSLAKRFAVEAASELVSLSAYLADVPNFDTRCEHIGRVARQERSIENNGWKAALYAALATSDWYCSTGYSMRVD